MAAADKGVETTAQRIDKWLWCARMFKTRSLASRIVDQGGVRLTRADATTRVEKPSALVRPGDVLAFMTGARPRVVEVVGCAVRRGPAAEAALLYTDRSPSVEAAPQSGARSGGRTTKKDRRSIDRLTEGPPAKTE